MNRTSPQSPFQEPEFLRSRIIIPYDYETDVLAQQQDEARAAHLFALRCRRHERLMGTRRIMVAFWFSVVCFALAFLGACL